MSDRSPNRRARLAVTITFISHGLLYGSWATRIPEVKSHLHLSAGALGFALLAPALGALLTGRSVGYFATHYGSGRVTRAFAVLFFLTAWLPGIAWNLGSLFVALLLWGSATGCMDVSMNAQAVTVEKAYPRPIMSGFHAMWSVGTFAGALLGGISIALGVSVAWQQVVLGVIALTTVLVQSRFFLPDPAQVPHEVTVPTKKRRGSPDWRLVLLAIAGVCAMLSEGAVADWSGILLRDHLHVAGGLISAGFVAFTVAMTSGRLVGDRLVHAYGRSRCVAVGAMLGAVGMGGGLLLDQAVPMVIGFGILGLGLAVIVPVLYSSAADTKRDPAHALSVVATLGFGGTLFGPSLIGFVANGTSVHFALGLLPPLTLLAGILGVAGIRLTARRREL